MKKMLLALLVVGVVGFAGPRGASAQSDPALVKVPFQFVVGDRLLPAGTYRITTDSQDTTVLFLTSVSGKASSAFAATERTENPNPGDPQPHVAFKNVDGQYFLWRVTMPGSDARELSISKVEAERVLAKLNLMPIERAEPAK